MEDGHWIEIRFMNCFSQLYYMIIYTARWRMRNINGRGQQCQDTSSSCNGLFFRSFASCISTSLHDLFLILSGIGSSHLIGMNGCGAHCHKASFSSYCTCSIFRSKSCCLWSKRSATYVCVYVWGALPCIYHDMRRFQYHDQGLFLYLDLENESTWMIS